MTKTYKTQFIINIIFHHNVYCFQNKEQKIKKNQIIILIDMHRCSVSHVCTYLHYLHYSRCSNIHGYTKNRKFGIFVSIIVYRRIHTQYSITYYIFP